MESEKIRMEAACHVGASFVSLAPTYLISRSALTPPLILFKPQTLALVRGLRKREMESEKIRMEAARQLRKSLFGTNPRLAARLLSWTGIFFAPARDPFRWVHGRISAV